LRKEKPDLHFTYPVNPADFTNPTAGRVILHRTGYHAFIPAPLPPTLTLDGPTVLALSRADAALSELSGLGRIIPNPHLLIGPLLRREAVKSSRIEGTRTTLSELLLEEARQKRSDDSDMREVRNYVDALEHGIGLLPSLPLSLRLVRQIHAQLMAGGRASHVTPGEFRLSQNWIGPAGSTPATATYVPPPVEEMTELLAGWERYLHVRDQVPDLVQCAVMHEHFEAIHPFLDGNGRVGRLLVTLFLIERGRLSQPLLYLSDFIERHREDYYTLLLAVRTKGEWAPWIRYFLAGVTETATAAAQTAQLLVSLREQMVREFDVGLVDQLFSNPFISAPAAAAAMNASLPTARKALRSLEAKGVLVEQSKRKWGQYYVAKRILSIVERAP
jgi:Fic family protein